MLSKSDRILKELFNTICKCKDNYNQHRQLCSSREKTHKELDDYFHGATKCDWDKAIDNLYLS